LDKLEATVLAANPEATKAVLEQKDDRNEQMNMINRALETLPPTVERTDKGGVRKCLTAGRRGITCCVVPALRKGSFRKRPGKEYSARGMWKGGRSGRDDGRADKAEAEKTLYE
jgi:hypothetical protein